MTQSAVDPATVARVVLEQADGESVVVSVPGTDYRLKLMTSAPVRTEPGKRVQGVIRAQARRIDVVVTGGRYVEPVYGRPRRVQGSVSAVDPASDTVAVQVHERAPIVCKTDGRQRAGDFRVGQFVSLDVAPGATFTPLD